MSKPEAQVYGFHISPHGIPEAETLERVRRSQARTHTVLDSAGLAMKVYQTAVQVIAEEPIVIARIDYPDQDWTRWPFSDPDAFVRDRAGLMQGVLYLQFLNEPVVGGDVNRLRSLLDACRRFMDACAKYRVKGSVAGFADASTFERGWIDQGLFDDFLSHAVDWTRAGHGVINHHDYSYGAPMANGGGKPETDMLDAAAMQPNRWPTEQQMQDETKGAQSNWTAQRFMWPLNRARKLTGKGYLAVVGEYGPQDDMPHLRQNGLSSQIEAKFAGGQKLRGPLDQKRLYRGWWPQWSDEEAHMQIFIWQAETDPPEVLGRTLFALNEGADWVSFNYRRWPAFWPAFYGALDRIRASKRDTVVVTPPTLPPPVTTPVGKPADAGTATLGLLQTSTYINVRTAPTLDGSVVVQAKQDWALRLYPGGHRQANGYEWAYVEGDDFAGWMALVTPAGWAAQIQPDAAPQPPAPDFDAPPLVELGVPFVDQYGTDAAGPNACGPAAAAMILRYIAIQNGDDLGTMTTLTPKQVSDAMGRKPGQFTTLDQILVVADQAYGVELNKVTVTPDMILNELRAGRPVLALVERGELPGTQAYYRYTRAHFVVVIGFGPNYVILHDPLGTEGKAGDGLKVSFTALVDALKRSSYRNADGSIGYNAGNRALLIDPTALPVPGPDEDEDEPEDEPEDETPRPPVDESARAEMLDRLAAMSRTLFTLRGAATATTQALESLIADITALNGDIAHLEDLLETTETEEDL